MARPSARPRLIDAALAVVEAHGVTALTLDAVADEAGVTKRGLIYHFPSKHALLQGVHEELAARLERRLLDATGAAPEDATLVERTRGYVRAAMESPGTAELSLVVEAADEPDWLAPWERVYRRWFPEEGRPVEELDDLALRCLVARMAADGSWAHESTGQQALTREARDRLADAILGPLEGE